MQSTYTLETQNQAKNRAEDTTIRVERISYELDDHPSWLFPTKINIKDSFTEQFYIVQRHCLVIYYLFRSLVNVPLVITEDVLPLEESSYA